MKTTVDLLIFALIACSVNSCIVSRDERVLKRISKDWRESPVILSAWADSPLAGNFLILLDNGRFERTSSGMFQSFEAGSWSKEADTFYLNYLDHRQNLIRNEIIYRDSETSTLVVKGDSTPVQFRMRVTIPEF